MVIIKFPNGSSWSKANWVFRQIVEDILGLCPHDQELEFQLRRGEALGLLSLEREEAESAAQSEVYVRALAALKRVAEGTLVGDIGGWAKIHPNDKDGQRMYREAVSELLQFSEAAIAHNS